MKLLNYTFLIFCFTQSLVANDLQERYFSYLEQLHLPNGDYQLNEIEVLTDPIEIKQVEHVQEMRLLNKGYSIKDAKAFSKVGIVSEDQYWVWLRDAVYFPNKIPGTYDRLLWKSKLKSPYSGVCILPILPSKKIALNLNYRHATRSWELELPRGGIMKGEPPKEAAIREAKEETGFLFSNVDLLGIMNVDSGVLSTQVPVFVGYTSEQVEALPEYSESIADVVALSLEEVNKGLERGFLNIQIENTMQKVPLRDSFLTYALYQAQLQKIF